LEKDQIGVRTKKEKRRLVWLQMKQNKEAYLMLAPFMLIFLVFTIIPVLMSLPIGLTDFDMVKYPPDLQRPTAATDRSGNRPRFRRYLHGNRGRSTNQCRQLYRIGERAIERELCAAFEGNTGIFHRQKGCGIVLGNHILYLRRSEPRAHGDGHRPDFG
jgi:ABC-type sugar transport system permease subunit